MVSVNSRAGRTGNTRPNSTQEELLHKQSFPLACKAAAEFLPEKYGALKLIDAMSGGQLKKS